MQTVCDNKRTSGCLGQNEWIAEGQRKLLGLIEIHSFLTVVVLSQVYVKAKTHRIVCC